MHYIGMEAMRLAAMCHFDPWLVGLSVVLAIRAVDVFDPRVDLGHKNADHVVLSRLLRRKAEILEIPVRFVPLAPDRVKRTSAVEGMRALATLVTHRFTARPAEAPARPYAAESATAERPLK